MLRRFCSFVVVFVCLANVSFADGWKAGVARSVITPPEYMWMSGYGNRSAPADGKIHDLYVRVALLQDANNNKLLFVSTDLVGVPIKMVKAVAPQIEKVHGIPRERMMFTCSHTHCGPALDEQLSHMLAMTDADWAQVRKYQTWLNEKLLGTVKSASENMEPVTVAFESGTCGFANNRRPPIGEGPVDHDVPVLRISRADGSIKGIIFGYACHNTTLGIQQWCGDYAGFAQLNLEETYSDSVAMFFTGCGADQNPLPRRTMELCEKYGRMLSVSVQEVLKGELEELEPTTKGAFREIPLEFSRAPSREEIEDKLANGSRYEKNWAKNMLADYEDGGITMTYPYPLQVWSLGKTIDNQPRLTWISMGGEVVVDYSLRFKKEIGQRSTWVTGYAHDVMAYIPSERVLKEGGYEGERAMLYYQKPSAWKPGLEEQIVNTIHELRKP